MKEELKKRHKQERDALASKLDQDTQREEDELKKHANSELEQLLREKKNRNAAELAARTDLSQEQLAEVSGCFAGVMQDHRKQVIYLRDPLTPRSVDVLQE